MLSAISQMLEKKQSLSLCLSISVWSSRVFAPVLGGGVGGDGVGGDGVGGDGVGGGGEGEGVALLGFGSALVEKS